VLSEPQNALEFGGVLVYRDESPRPATATERRSKITRPANGDSALDGGGDRRDGQISEDDDMAHDGNGQEQPAKEKASERPPQNLIRSPALEKPTTFSSLWYPLPTTMRFFISKPAAVSFFMAVSAALWSEKTAMTVPVVSIWFSFRTTPRPTMVYCIPHRGRHQPAKP